MEGIPNVHLCTLNPPPLFYHDSIIGENSIFFCYIVVSLSWIGIPNRGLKLVDDIVWYEKYC